MSTTTTVSGITPSGRLTLGNHLGALRRFADDPDGYYFVSDLHAMTTRHDPAHLRALTLETAALLLAAGVPEGRVFVQSHVPEHAQMAYLVECTAYVGELGRMVQFREKGRGRPATRASLFTYPCLMAADILLYDATHVPVGGDQDQHVELARDVAVRFNRAYGDVLVVPRTVRAAVAARVADLQDPGHKMSKSAPDDAPGVIRLLDDPATVARKIRRAVTDSGSDVRHDPATKPGISNLLDVLGACTGRDPVALAEEVAGYGALKHAVIEAVEDVLRPLRRRHAELLADPAGLSAVLRDGRDHARERASATLARASEAAGLVAA